MLSYQLKIIVHANKHDEFINYLCSLSDGIQTEEGCLDFSLYKDLSMNDTYCVLAEWSTTESMEKHFSGKRFIGLIGATRVLGSNFEMTISTTLEKGSYLLAKEKIALKA